MTYLLSSGSDDVQVVASPKTSQPDPTPPCLLEGGSSRTTIGNFTGYNMGEATHVKGTTVTSKQLGMFLSQLGMSLLNS